MASIFCSTGRMKNMAVVIHVEVSAREIDSKLLLAVVAASRGHSVILGDVIWAARSKLLPPSIFHTKALTPWVEIIKRHSEIVQRGHKITSLDEEANLVRYEDDNPDLRYGDKTVEQASAIFCWGHSGFTPLIKRYPQHSDKIFVTGSPRADLWDSRFKDYWRSALTLPQEPYLLISSNMGERDSRLSEYLTFLRGAGYFDRDEGSDVRFLVAQAEKMLVFASFVEAIKTLSSSANHYKIILRPHPRENLETWRVLLDGLPNVEVTREGSISSWLHGAFALLHNGCTTALEATLAGKAVISYSNFDQHDLQLSNDLGSKATNLEELTALVDQHWTATQSMQAQPQASKDKNLIGRKIHTKENELAAERIVDVWDTLGAKNSIPVWSLVFLKIFLAAKYLRDKIFLPLLPSAQRRVISYSKQKFPPIQFLSLKNRVRLLEALIGHSDQVRVNRLGERTVLIRPPL